jgi:glucose-6-phosphate isomerase/2-phospho-L-lactate transferase/gluconeogenesis factor (CofD/UPF0052 family)/hydroxymethylpyrimidine pyrophosphatase-like HAD family hydrolase
MHSCFRIKRRSLFYRLCIFLVNSTFIFSIVIPPVSLSAQGIPQSILNLPVPGTMVSFSPIHQPALITGITIHPEDPLQFDFVINNGDSQLEAESLRETSTKLIKYFMASLTVPEQDLWVNLSPNEKDRIIPEGFGVTEMGRDLLAQDYLLKQLSASLMYPEDELGKKFWKRVYQKAAAKLGTTQIPVNTFNKIWIVPDKAVVYEHQNSAFILDSHLKVMLEEDYQTLKANQGDPRYGMETVSASKTKALSEVSAEVVREILIPEIEKEVNEGETFANLRQIYHSMILATWYKQNLKESLLGQVYVDQNKIKGIDIEDKDVKQKIYEQYLAAFQKGVYNYIKEDYDPAAHQVIARKYVSGGAAMQVSRVTTRFTAREIRDLTPSQLLTLIRNKGENNLSQDEFALIANWLGRSAKQREEFFRLAQFASNVETHQVNVTLVENAGEDQRSDIESSAASSPIGSATLKAVSSRILSTTPANISHDVRGFIKGELSRAFGDKYRLYEGGFASLDIMPKGIDKESALTDVFQSDPTINLAIYYADEFFKTARKTGNDTPILNVKNTFKDKTIIIFSVDKDPQARTDEAKQNTIWIGEGPSATQRVIDQINDAIAAGNTTVTIRGQGVDSEKSIEINLAQLRNQGVMFFDVDGTLLQKKSENFSNQDQMRKTFDRALGNNLRMGIISGNSSDEQMARIATPLKGMRDDISKLSLYVNGGATKVTYSSTGEVKKVNLAEDIPQADIQRVKAILTRLARENFGLDVFEVAAWKDWLKQQTQPGADFAGVNFQADFDSSLSFNPSVVTPKDFIDAKSGTKTPIDITDPFIENRDGVQLSIKLLPQSVHINPAVVQKRRMLQLLGLRDLIAQQRLAETQIDTEAILNFLIKYFTDLGLNPAEVDQQTFNRHFGSRPIVSVAGFATRFSNFIHKGMAFGGIDRHNTMNALEGAYTTPGVKPLVFIGEKILGLVVKDEYLRGFDEEKFYFIVSKETLKTLESEVIIDSKFLDGEKVRRYFGRESAELILSFTGPFGHGDNMKKAILKLKEKLPVEEQVPFSQVAFGEMAEAIRPSKSNASLITYLKMLEAEAQAYQSKNYDMHRPIASAGGKLAQKNEAGKLILSSINRHGHFFLNNGRLVVYSDWDQIAHKTDLNKGDVGKAGYDRVVSNYGKIQEILEQTLARIKELPLEQRRTKIAELRADSRFSFFAISDEGEVFSQENLVNVIDKINDWALLSEAEKEYLKRHYAIVDNGKTADLLISSNTGIFRNTAVENIVEELNQEEIENGFRLRDSGKFIEFGDQLSSDDKRKPGRWMGIDPKDNNTKTLAWNLFRVLSDHYRGSHSKEDVPIFLTFVGKAPSSVKDAQGQMAFVDFYAQEYNLDIGQSGLEDIQASEIARAIRENDLDGAVDQLINRMKEGVGIYRREIQNLFKSFANDIKQLQLFTLLNKVNQRLLAVLEKESNREIIQNAKILWGINRQVMSEAIDAGYVGHVKGLAQNSDYVDELVNIYQAYRDSARQRKKVEYITVQLAHVVKRQLDQENFEQEVQAFITKLKDLDYIDTLTKNREAARQAVKIRNLLSMVSSIDEKYNEYLRDITRDLSVGLMQLAESKRDSLRNLLDQSGQFVADRSQDKPDRKVVLITGGTAVGSLWVQSLNETDGFRNVEVTSIVGNVDDGGSSYDIVNVLNQAGYGVIPPPGDKINTLQGFMSRDKREHLMGDSGRLPKGKEAPQTLIEGTAVKIAETLSDFMNVDRVESDFFYFARILLMTARHVDQINEEIMQNVEKKIETQENRQLSEAEIQALKKKRTIQTAGASIRNLYVLGFLRDFGVISSPESLRNEENVDVLAYEKALKAMVQAANVYKTFVTVSSFDPKTVYAQYKGYTMLLKSPDGTTVPIVMEEEKTGALKVMIPQTSVGEKGVFEAVERVLQNGEELLINSLTFQNETTEATQEHPVIGYLNQKLRIKNVDGRLQMSIGTATWRVDDLDLDDGRLVRVSGMAPKDTIDLANDGTGRAREFEGRNEETPMFQLQNEDGSNTGVYFRGRLVKMQTNITETVNFSTIERFGFLEGGLGLKGEIPDRIRRQTPNQSMIEKIRSLEKGDITVIGPGSFYTSILPHFLVDGLGEELVAARKRGVKVIFAFNSTRDNETVNLSNMDMLEKIEAAVGKNTGLDAMISHLIAIKDYDIPSNIRQHLNPVVEADIRTDPRAASKAAKKNRGALILTKEENDAIQNRWKKLQIFALDDALTLVQSQARESNGAKTVRVLHDVKKVAGVLDEISPSKKTFRIVQERNSMRSILHGVPLNGQEEDHGKKSSSPITFPRAPGVINANVNRYLEAIMPAIGTQLREIYGKDKQAAAQLARNKFAQIGFDGEHNRLGWTLPHLSEILADPQKIEGVISDADQIRRDYKYVIFSGMGGSGLSVQAVKTTFGEPRGVKIFSLRTTDPAVIKEIVDEIAVGEKGNLAQALRKTKIVVVSKSGTTQETRSHQQYFEALYKAQQVDSKGHFMLVTDPGSPMEKEASEKGYDLRHIQLNGKTDIGGRFTAPTTTVFLLPLALVVPDQVKMILERAKAMNDKEVAEDIFARLGVFLYHTGERLGMDKVTFLVPPELRDLPVWSEQLFEESLGKEGKGITLVYGENLAPEQLKSTGKSDRVFVRFNLSGRETQKDLADYLRGHNYPLFDIQLDGVNDLGGVMLGLQRAVATIAYLWDINFVNQPGVEGYKRQTREVLAKLEDGAKVEIPKEWQYASYKGGLNVYYTPFLEAGIVTLDELQEEVSKLNADLSNAPAVYTALINIAAAKGLDKNFSGGRFEVAELASYGRMTDNFRQIIEDARFRIFTDGLKMTSKVAEGPDKNHSFQQNIAEGKNMFFSTYFMPLKAAQPQVLEYDENSLKAQTLGTVNSLVEVGRKVVLISLNGSIAESEAITRAFFNEVQTLVSASSPISSLVIDNVYKIVDEENGWAVLREMQELLSFGTVQSENGGRVLPILRMDQGDIRQKNRIGRNIINAVFKGKIAIVMDAARLGRESTSVAIMSLSSRNLFKTLSRNQTELLAVLSAVEAKKADLASSPIGTSPMVYDVLDIVKQSNGWPVLREMQELLADGQLVRSQQSGLIYPFLLGASPTSSMPWEQKVEIAKQILERLLRGNTEQQTFTMIDDHVLETDIPVFGLATKTLSINTKDMFTQILAEVEAKRAGTASSSPIPSVDQMERIRAAVDAIRSKEGDFPMLARLLNQGIVWQDINGPTGLTKDSIIRTVDRPTGRTKLFLINEVYDGKVYALAQSGMIQRFNINDDLRGKAQYFAIPERSFVSSPISVVDTVHKLVQEQNAWDVVTEMLEFLDKGQILWGRRSQRPFVPLLKGNQGWDKDRTVAAIVKAVFGEEVWAVSDRVLLTDKDEKGSIIDTYIEGVGLPKSDMPDKQIESILRTKIQPTLKDVLTKVNQKRNASSPLNQNGKKKVGGIDLNPALLDLQIKRDGSGVPLPLPQQPVDTMRIDGFLPVIINITPMPIPNLQMILGRDEPAAPSPADAADGARLQPQDDRRSRLSRLEKHDFVVESYR